MENSSHNNDELENVKLSLSNIEKENDQLKRDYANLENGYKKLVEQRNQQKNELDKEKQKISSIFNDDTLIKLYYSKDWKNILKIYSFKKKYLSNDSAISKKINSFVNIFKPKKKYKFSKKNISLARLAKLQKKVDYSKVLTIPFADAPTVSIVIPVYNGWEMNYRCVKSIIENTSAGSYEIIFADDCSADETKNCTTKITNLVHIYNSTNLGFLRNCNNAAKSARGEFILFLNNDTEVTDNWLSSLTTLITSDKKIGMVGSKLIYPDGRLQEAGGIIWNDSSGWNYGKDQDPDAAEYNYVKEADYISGASIMIRKNLWQELGGFDDRYAPAYCEDSDLAFAVRDKGYKVMYQPLSEVFHFESVSHGKEEKVEEGKVSIQSVRLINQKKLYEKWKEVFLREQFPNAQNIFQARDRTGGKKTILVVDHYAPEYDKDAGSKTVFQYLGLLVSLGLNVKFIGDNFLKQEPYTTALQQMGIEVLNGDYYKHNWKTWIQTNKEYIDFVFLNRPHTSLNYITFIKQNTNAKILYYGHDLHFLRELRKYEIDKDPATLNSSNQWKSKEQFIYEHSDYILTPSDDETRAIMQISPSYKVTTILPYFFKEPAYPVDDFTNTRNILFVGGFGHSPNVDGILWFCKNVWPLVTAKIEGIKFTIAGSKPTAEINNLQSENIEVLGFVSEFELSNLYKKSRIAIIPMRYGAGVKGKTVEAMYHGVPIVSTTIGLEGMPGISDFANPFDDAESFANELIALYNNKERLIEMSLNETTYINKHFTWNAAGNQIKDLLDI
ncbi:MAG: glycosyltransferase [Ferruginibacter sp.]